MRWVEERPEVGPPPEIRADFLTMVEALRLIESRPEWQGKMRGDLQMHTTWSDGSGSVLEMAHAATSRGYDYIAITDHSKGLKIAGGIDEAQLARQEEEINRVNKSLRQAEAPLQVLRSIELNLNPRGEGDMDEAALARLDLVLGSFHSALRKTDDQTDRYLAALRNPTIQILGHPRGRIFNYRLGLKADWARVFETAAKMGKAVEIDSYPDRQDLSVELATLAAGAGCYISIGTDAHHPWQLEFISLGAAAALQAGVRPDRILNFLSRDRLLAWVDKVRGRSQR